MMHIMNLHPVNRYRFSSCLRRTGEGLGLFWHVNIVERYDVSKRPRKTDQPLGRIRRNRLTPLVMPHIALGASHAYRQHGLSDAQALTDGFNGVHP